MGSLCSLKLFAEYRWVTWVSRLVGKLMMLMASKGHFFGQIPQPIHRRSEMKAILESGVTSMHSLPVRTTGHDFLHSCLHFCLNLAHGLESGNPALTFGLHYHREHPHVSHAKFFCVEGRRGGTLSELIMAILWDVSQVLLLVLSRATYRVSLSDMVVVVGGLWTRLQRMSRVGVGGVNFGLQVCQRETTSRAGKQNRAARQTNTGGRVLATTLRAVREWRRRRTSRGEIRRAFFL